MQGLQQAAAQMQLAVNLEGLREVEAVLAPLPPPQVGAGCAEMCCDAPLHLHLQALGAMLLLLLLPNPAAMAHFCSRSDTPAELRLALLYPAAAVGAGGCGLGCWLPGCTDCCPLGTGAGRCAARAGGEPRGQAGGLVRGLFGAGCMGLRV